MWVYISAYIFFASVQKPTSNLVLRWKFSNRFGRVPNGQRGAACFPALLANRFPSNTVGACLNICFSLRWYFVAGRGVPRCLHPVGLGSRKLARACMRTIKCPPEVKFKSWISSNCRLPVQQCYAFRRSPLLSFNMRSNSSGGTGFENR